MKIIVCMKQVPARDSILRVSSHGKQLDESGLTFETNGPDTYALEAALHLRDKLGCEVVVLCAGPERAAKTIREALAKGANRGIHVLTQEGAHPEQDPFSLAVTLAGAAKAEMPDLLLTGLQSEDNCSGQTGVVLAELLGYAHATIVTEVEPLAHEVRVKKELEDGWSQYVTLPMPAVLSIQSGQTKPRLASMMGIRQARQKEIKVIAAAGLPECASGGTNIGRIFKPAQQSQVQLFTGEARDCARQLLEHLRSEARVL